MRGWGAVGTVGPAVLRPAPPPGAPETGRTWWRCPGWGARCPPGRTSSSPWRGGTAPACTGRRARTRESPRCRSGAAVPPPAPTAAPGHTTTLREGTGVSTWPTVTGSPRTTGKSGDRGTRGGLARREGQRGESGAPGAGSPAASSSVSGQSRQSLGTRHPPAALMPPGVPRPQGGRAQGWTQAYLLLGPESGRYPAGT